MTARIQAPPRRRRRSGLHPTLLTPTTLQRIHPSPVKPVAIAWSSSGTYLAVATQHGPLFLFYVLTAKRDVIRANPIRTFLDHSADIMHMSFSHLDFLITGSMDRSVRLWHADANVCLRKFLHPDMLTAVAFHPKDHNFVLSGCCDGVVRVWRLPDHACIAQAEVGAVVTTAQFGHDGTRTFVGTYDGRVIVLDLKDVLDCVSQDAIDSPVRQHTSRDVSSLMPSNSSDFEPPAVIPTLKTLSVRQRRARRKSPPKIRGMCVRAKQKETLVVTSDARVHVLGKEGDVSSTLKAGIRKEGTTPLGSSISPDGRYILHDAVGGMVRVLKLDERQRGESPKRRERDIPVSVESLPITVDGNVSCAAFASGGVLDNVRPGEDSSDRYLMAVGIDDGSILIVESGCVS